MSSSCVITFNESPDGVYYCGQKISGKVNLVTDKIKAIKGIYITVRGFADVRWTETKSGGMVHRVYYRSHDEYFRSRTDILMMEKGNRFDLQPGSYEYKFETFLPYVLPSSFIGRYGEVRYEVVLTINRPWRFDNIFKQPFTVIYPLDLNKDHKYKQSVDRTVKNRFTKFFCCGDGGEILVTAHMPYCGYAPGQHIPVDIIIKNFSATECSEMKVKLVKVAEYHSSTPSCKRKFDTITLVEQTFGPYVHFREKSLNCCLRVPSVPPTTFRECKVIGLSYYVDITLRTRGLHSNINMRLPVTIGAIPLYYGGELTPNTISRHPSSTSLLADDIFTIPAPPSYEEATRIDADYVSDSDENQNMKSVPYIPRYPVYYEFDDMILGDRFVSNHHHPLNETKQRY